MEIVEWTKLGLLIILGICASYGDLKTGLITNRMVLSFSAIGLVLNVYYLGFIEQSDVIIFIGNLFSCIIVAFLLYRIHAFAGGDLKLVVAMSLLYPSSAYLTYNTSRITMFLAIGFAIFWGKNCNTFPFSRIKEIYGVSFRGITYFLDNTVTVYRYLCREDKGDELQKADSHDLGGLCLEFFLVQLRGSRAGSGGGCASGSAAGGSLL